jgi:hypothetical protein
MAMEKTSHIRCSDPTIIATDGQRCFHEGSVGKGTEKPYGIEKIRFSDAVRTGDARERSEADINVHEILDARYL